AVRSGPLHRPPAEPQHVLPVRRRSPPLPRRRDGDVRDEDGARGGARAGRPGHRARLPHAADPPRGDDRPVARHAGRRGAAANSLRSPSILTPRAKHWRDGVRMAESTAATGIEGLDDILRGGLPRDRLYLVAGDPGTGKTTLGLQFLLEGARTGERGLYVALSETRDELEATARSHGWSLDALEV